MSFHGCLGNSQAPGDLSVTHRTGRQLEYLAFPIRKDAVILTIQTQQRFPRDHQRYLSSYARVRACARAPDGRDKFLARRVHMDVPAHAGVEQRSHQVGYIVGADGDNPDPWLPRPDMPYRGDGALCWRGHLK